MALSQELLLIIVIGALIAILLLIIAVTVYLCFRRRRNSQRSQDEVRTTNHYIPPRADNSGDIKARLDRLPTAKQTKNIEGGNVFVDSGGSDNRQGKHIANDSANYIMGPSVQLADGEHKTGAVDNKTFIADNQVDSGAYFRDGIDPADVAEAYMKDEYMKQATRSRRQRQLEIRRENTKKSAAKKRNSRPSSGGNKQIKEKPCNAKGGDKEASTKASQ